jgi:hypothetical protein
MTMNDIIDAPHGWRFGHTEGRALVHLVPNEPFCVVAVCGVRCREEDLKDIRMSDAKVCHACGKLTKEAP